MCIDVPRALKPQQCSILNQWHSQGVAEWLLLHQPRPRGPPYTVVCTDSACATFSVIECFNSEPYSAITLAEDGS